MASEPNKESLTAGHVRRYGLTTVSALRSLVFPTLSVKAVTRLTERLADSLWLTRRRLPGGGRYFVLGDRAAKELGCDPGSPFGYQALVNRIGVLHFCAKLGVEVFTSAEFRGTFPELAKRGMSASNYYIEPGEVRRLAFIHVDHGRTSERLVTKMRSRISGRYRDPDFAALIQQDRFLIAIATATEEKTRAVIRELEDRDPTRVRFRVETVPELFPLLVEGRPRTRRPRHA
ncbi:MAG: hypothetical protein U0790_02145 [Isosphaeraceae bacterium]